jgi:pimeloyl-ACP methyl ester carboxylesterase
MTPATSPAAIGLGNGQPRMRDLRVAALDGQRIAYTDRGRGSTVLLLHGIGSAHDAFAPQVPALEDGYRCVAWDAPGYGHSSDPPSPPGMGGYAAAAADLLAHLDATPAHLVGVSWGAVIAVRLALRHPHLVRSLVLADSSRGAGTDPERAFAMRRRSDDLRLLGAGQFAAQRAPKLVTGASPDLADDVAAAMARAIRLPGYGWAADALAQTDHLPRLAELRLPTLVVVGEHDAVTGVDASRELATAIPGARLEVIPGAGHLANQERPATFNRLVRGFLDEVDENHTATRAVHVPGGTAEQ